MSLQQAGLEQITGAGTNDSQTTQNSDSQTSLGHSIFESDGPITEEGAGVGQQQQAGQQQTNTGAGTANVAVSTNAANQQVNQQQQQQVAGQPGQPQAQPVQLTPELIATLAAQTSQQTIAALQSQQQQQTQAQKQLTPEEIDRQFNVVRPSEQDIQTLFAGGATAVQTMENLLHSTSKMAVTIGAAYANQQITALRQEIMQQLAPTNEYVQSQQMVQAVNEFYTKYPDLKSVEPLLVQIKNGLEASGFRGTKEQVYEKISSEAYRILKGANITLPQGAGDQGQAGVVQQQQQQAAGQNQSAQTASQRTMSPLSGGRAGAVGAASGAGNKSPGQAVFED